jgi:hypothetical protein
LPGQRRKYAEYHRLDFKGIARQALSCRTYVLERLLPGGRIEGREYVALNPLRADKSLGSFRINLDTGHWADFATNDRGRDLISLTAYLLFCGRQGPAAKYLREMIAGVPFVGGTYYDR